MVERRHDPSQTGDVVLDIGDGFGALILYTGPELHGQEIEVSPVGDDLKRVHSDIKERRVGSRKVFAAVYPDLAEGDYRIWTERSDVRREFTVVSGQVAEVDWT